MLNQFVQICKYSTILLAIGFIVSCTPKVNERYLNPKYGKTLRANLNGAPAHIFPGQVLRSSEQIITTQVYNGLIKYHTKNLEIIPSIANKWRIEREGTIYTFFLNPDARFHDDKCFENGKGRHITANDFKYSIEQICRTHINNNYTLSKQVSNIKGFNQFLETEKNNDTSDIKGIVAYDDTTLVFQLKESDEMFIHFLAGTNALVFPKEAFDAYGFNSTVGSGPFLICQSKNKAQSVTLCANLNFFGKNRQGEQLPFLDTIRFSFITSMQQELMLFKNNKIDLILSLNEKNISPFLDENIDLFQSNPPYYVMRQTFDYEKNVKYNIFRSNINDLNLNSQDYFDFSMVYFEEPKPQEIQIIN